MHVFYALLTVTHSNDWLLPGNQNTRDRYILTTEPYNYRIMELYDSRTVALQCFSGDGVITDVRADLNL